MPFLSSVDVRWLAGLTLLALAVRLAYLHHPAVVMYSPPTFILSPTRGVALMRCTLGALPKST
jgi:hypothetical protein